MGLYTYILTFSYTGLLFTTCCSWIISRLICTTPGSTPRLEQLGYWAERLNPATVQIRTQALLWIVHSKWLLDADFMKAEAENASFSVQDLYGRFLCPLSSLILALCLSLLAHFESSSAETFSLPTATSDTLLSPRLHSSVSCFTVLKIVTTQRRKPATKRHTEWARSPSLSPILTLLARPILLWRSLTATIRKEPQSNSRLEAVPRGLLCKWWRGWRWRLSFEICKITEVATQRLTREESRAEWRRWSR